MKRLRNAAAAAVALWAGKKALRRWQERRSKRRQPLQVGGDGFYTEPPTPRD